MPPISPSSGFHYSHPGGVDSEHSYENLPLDEELALDPSLANIEAFPEPPQGELPLIPLHYPFKNIHKTCPPPNFAQDSDDEQDPDDKDWMDNRPADCYNNQEFNDHKADSTPEIKEEWPLHHLTYVSYPMRAPDVLRHGWVNPESNAYLRPGTNNFKGPVINDDSGPDGLRLIFVAWLKKYSMYPRTGVSVGLWRTQGTGELVVVKRIKGFCSGDAVLYSPNTQLFRHRIPNVPREQRGGLFPPGEIRFMDMSDNRTQRVTKGGFRFPWNPLLTCFPQTHAYQIHDYLSDSENITHFGKFYNGGTVEGVIKRYKDLEKPIPESFIWHVIAQIGRAFKYMHTGRTMPDKTQPRGSRRGPPREGQEEDEFNRKEDERARTWKKVSHHDSHQANVWLHFPTEYEREHDTASGANCLAHFDENFPQVILGDFGLAFNELNTDYVSRRWNLDTCPDLPDYETWKDKAEFGLTLVHLLLAGKPDIEIFNHKKHPLDWAEQFDRYLRLHYSSELIDVVKRFRYMATLSDLNRFGEYIIEDRIRDDYLRWHDQGWDLRLSPNNAWFHNTMIDLADAKLHTERVRLARLANIQNLLLANPAQAAQAQNAGANNTSLLLLHNAHLHSPPSLSSTISQRIATIPYLIKNRIKFSSWPNNLLQNRYAVPIPGRETYRSKARTLYVRKMRRPITAAFYRHPPDPIEKMDTDKYWVVKTYRMERVRYRVPRGVKVEREMRGEWMMPPKWKERRELKRKMFGGVVSGREAAGEGVWEAWNLGGDGNGENRMLRLDFDEDFVGQVVQERFSGGG